MSISASMNNLSLPTASVAGGFGGGFVGMLAGGAAGGAIGSRVFRMTAASGGPMEGFVALCGIGAMATAGTLIGAIGGAVAGSELL